MIRFTLPRPRTLAVILASIGLFSVSAAPASAAGVHTHAAMAEAAVDHVRDRHLHALLTQRMYELHSGAFFPDSGYIARGIGFPDYGETSHWQEFVDASIDDVRRDRLCRLTLTLPNGPCAARIAHLMGAAAHGMGDETWDWMFEPAAKDFGESATDLGPDPLGTVEYAMDQVLLRDGLVSVRLPLFVPRTSQLLETYRSYGRTDITAAAILAGVAAQNAQSAAQQALAPVEGLRVRLVMPQMARNFVSAPGGVEFSGRAIAGYLDAIWARLRGATPALRVVATVPADGETGLATAWQPARIAPGPNGGGARTRIVAVFNGAPVPASVTADTVSLRRLDGTPVVLEPGTPKLGPWGPDGTHSVLLHPAQDLARCTTYVAEVGAGVQAARQGAATPRSWRFTTAGC